MGQAKRKGATRQDRAHLAQASGRTKRPPNTSSQSRAGLAMQEAFEALTQIGVAGLAQSALAQGEHGAQARAPGEVMRARPGRPAS